MCRSEICPLPQQLCSASVLSADMPAHQLTKPMKPKLPRKLANSARINLNKYWQAFEELMPVTRRVFDEADSNAINENIDNERRLAAMQLSDTSGDFNGGATPEARSFPMSESLSTNILQSGKNTFFTKISSSIPSTAQDENTPPSSTPVGASR